MVKLYLVGFTTDLNELIFATRKGARKGSYIVTIDKRLTGTLEEVARLAKEGNPEIALSGMGKVVDPSPPSSLRPKEIQALLREGKSEDQVAKMANTDVSWIGRFNSPIIAERAGVIESVQAGTVSKLRLGPSSAPVGQSIQNNLIAKRVQMGKDAFDDGWKAVRKGGRWQVSFQYLSRGQRRVARFSFDPDTKAVEPSNSVALDLGWSGTEVKRPRRRVASAVAKSRAKAKPKTKAKQSLSRGKTAPGKGGSAKAKAAGTGSKPGPGRATARKR